MGSGQFTELFSQDVSDANFWKGYIQKAAVEKGVDVDVTIPVPRSEIKEISISVVHCLIGTFMVNPQSEELMIPIDKLVLNHKFQPTGKVDGINTNVYLVSENSNSLTIRFKKYDPTLYVCGKVAWR